MKNSTTKKVKVAKGGTFGYEEKERKKICKSIADVAGFVKNAEIEVTFDSYYGNDGVQERGTNHKGKASYLINVKKTGNRSSKTDMEDSVAHVLFPSAKIAYDKKKSDFVNFADPKDLTSVTGLCDDVFTALEKARVKSCMSIPYKGYADRATEANIADGQEITSIEDPVQALHAAQLGLEKLVADSDFPMANDYVKAIERTGNKATVIATKEYMEQVVQPWYQSVTEPEKPKGDQEDPNGEEGNDDGKQEGQGKGNEQEGEGDGEGEGEGEGEGGEGKPKWYNDPVSDAQKRYIKKLGGDPEQPNNKGQASELISDLLNDDAPTPEQPEPQGQGNMDVMKAAMRNSDMTDKGTGKGCDPNIDLNETVEEQKVQGEKEIEEVEDKIAEFQQKEEPVDTTKLSQPDIEHRIGHSKETDLKAWTNHGSTPNMAVVNQLKPIFKRLKSKMITEADTTGTDVDVDEYIKNQIEGGVDFLTTPEEERGFAVVIGVDESGSMSGHNIQSARNLCATLYKAFEEMPNVDIYVFGWTTGVGGLQIKKITNIKDVGRLDGTGGTPFLEATYFCANFVEQLPHKKKLFFQITDGDVYSDGALEKYFAKLRRANMDVTGIQIGYYGSSEMKNLFGKNNFIHTQDMHGAGSTITKSIVQQFVRCIK